MNWKLITLGAVLFAVLSAGQLAVARELTAAVGTDAWLVPPDGFEPAPQAADKFTFANSGAAAVISVSQGFPLSPVHFDLDKLAADPDKLSQMAGVFPRGKAEIVEAGENRFLLISGDMPAGTGLSGRVWTATPGQPPVVTFTFVQLEVTGVQPVLDDERVEEVLASVVVSRPSAVAAGLYVGGLHVPAMSPFVFPELTDVGSGRLHSVDGDHDARAGSPRISLLYAYADPEVLGLEQLGAKWLGLAPGSMLTSSTAADFLDVPALRQEWASAGKSGPSKTVGYVAFVGGQGVVLFATGQENRMTDEIVGTFDKIAAAVRPGKP